jgi:hypothetical protein
MDPRRRRRRDCDRQGRRDAPRRAHRRVHAAPELQRRRRPRRSRPSSWPSPGSMCSPRRRWGCC